MIMDSTNHSVRSGKYFIRSIFFLSGIFFFDNISHLIDYNLAVLRYIFATFALYYHLRMIISTWNQRLKFDYFKSFYYFIFTLYLFTVIFRGLSLTFSGFQNNIYFKVFISGQLLLYLLPVIIYSEPSIVLIKKLFKLVLFLCGIYLISIFPVYYFYESNQTWSTEEHGIFLASAGAILMLTLPYHSMRIRWMVLSVILIALLISVISGRRNQFIYFGSVLFFAGYISTMGSSRFVRSRRLASIATVFFITALIASIFAIYSDSFNPFVERMQTGFESREVVTYEFLDDFKGKPLDWAFGRGMNGEYFSKTTSFTFKGGRDTIENGYFYSILKGGIFYLALVSFLMLIAFYKGFFRSKNLLVKAFAALILIQFIDMIGFGIPLLSIKYWIVWFSIPVCLSPYLRSLSDDYIKSIVRLR